MCKCEGGTKSNPCTKEAKYLLEWVMENVDLCAEHFDQEDNAKILREQIAQDIEADYAQQIKDGLGNFFGLSEEFCYKQAAAIARGQL